MKVRVLVSDGSDHASWVIERPTYAAVLDAANSQLRDGWKIVAIAVLGTPQTAEGKGSEPWPTVDGRGRRRFWPMRSTTPV